jgi:hypothetical protein
LPPVSSGLKDAHRGGLLALAAGEKQAPGCGTPRRKLVWVPPSAADDMGGKNWRDWVDSGGKV